MKNILVLVVASDNQPIYKKFQECWRQYTKICENIKVYFVYGKKSGTTASDEIVIDVEDNLRSGMILKTLGAIKKCQDYNYDFLLRTNLSSFFDFFKLTKLVETLPITNCYAGSICNDTILFASGCGFIISKDVAEAMIQGQDKFSLGLYEDMAFGEFVLKCLHLPIIELEKFDVISSLDQLPTTLINLESNTNKYFHFRVRNDANRLIVDSQIMEKLVQIHYEKKPCC